MYKALETTHGTDRNKRAHTQAGSCTQVGITISPMAPPSFLACACSRCAASGQGNLVMLGETAPPY